jgi:hypothetical protein
MRVYTYLRGLLPTIEPLSWVGTNVREKNFYAISALSGQSCVPEVGTAPSRLTQRALETSPMTGKPGPG